MTRMDRRALFTKGSAAALLAAAGVSAQAGPSQGGNLRAALSGGSNAESFFDSPGGYFLRSVRHAVFETLTEIAPDGTLQGGLSEAWSSSDGGHTWTFQLRSGVKFHDETRLTATDVRASLAAHSDIAQSREVGELVVELTLIHSDPDFPFKVASDTHSIFSARELGSGHSPITGTGLYRMERYDPGRNFLGRRVSQHRKIGQSGWFDTVEFIAVSDESIRAEAVRESIVDAADLSAPFDLGCAKDVSLLIDDTGVRGAVRSTVQHAPRLGPHPLDDLQFAKRWWMRA